MKCHLFDFGYWRFDRLEPYFLLSTIAENVKGPFVNFREEIEFIRNTNTFSLKEKAWLPGHSNIKSNDDEIQKVNFCTRMLLSFLFSTSPQEKKGEWKKRRTVQKVAIWISSKWLLRFPTVFSLFLHFVLKNS